MVYDNDFRNRVLQYVKDGHSKCETAATFGISTNTLYLWEPLRERQGDVTRKQRIGKPTKLPRKELEAYISAHPDAYLREIAEHFSCSISGAAKALKCLGITLKKRQPLTKCKTLKK